MKLTLLVGVEQPVLSDIGRSVVQHNVGLVVVEVLLEHLATLVGGDVLDVRDHVGN